MTQDEIFEGVEAMIPAELWEKYKHLSFGEMAEIAALRAELAPVPSLIVTGRQALDEFKRLQIPGGTVTKHVLR